MMLKTRFINTYMNTEASVNPTFDRADTSTIYSHQSYYPDCAFSHSSVKQPSNAFPDGICSSVLENKIPSTMQSQIEKPPLLNMRFQNMLNFPKYMGRKNLAFNRRIKRSGMTVDPEATLQLLRRFLQPLINKEINSILEHYMETFFIVAIKNIRANLGDGSVSDETLHLLRYRIMKAVTAKYAVHSVEKKSLHGLQNDLVKPPRRTRESYTIAQPTVTQPDNSVSDRLLLSLRRADIASKSYQAEPAPEEDSEAASSLASCSPRGLYNCSQPIPPGLSGASPSCRSPGLPPQSRRARESSQILFKTNAVCSNQESDLKSGKSPYQHSVKSGFASNARITPDSSFVLGSVANAWLGLGSARGRIYSKHPSLFRYLCDMDDKLWLMETDRLSNCGLRAFLMLADDVCQIADAEHSKAEGRYLRKRHKLTEFKLPSWLLAKVLNSISTWKNQSDNNCLSLSSERLENDHLANNFSEDSCSLFDLPKLSINYSHSLYSSPEENGPTDERYPELITTRSPRDPGISSSNSSQTIALCSEILPNSNYDESSLNVGDSKSAYENSEVYLNPSVNSLNPLKRNRAQTRFENSSSAICVGWTGKPLTQPSFEKLAALHSSLPFAVSPIQFSNKSLLVRTSISNVTENHRPCVTVSSFQANRLSRKDGYFEDWPNSPSLNGSEEVQVHSSDSPGPTARKFMISDTF